MENPLNLVMKLSLEEIVLRRIVVNLFNEADVSATILNFQINARHGEFKNKEDWCRTVEETVKSKVSNLHLPHSLKKQMMSLVTPVGNEILRWKLFYKEFDATVLEQLCWSSAGMVDDRKTAEKVVRLERFDIVKRYQLACLYCLEDCLPALWEDLPKERKQELFLILDRWSIRSVDLEVYWAYVLRGEKPYLDSVISERFGVHETFTSSHQCAFETSVRSRNKAATEYLFQLLTNEERDSSLVRVTNEVIDHSAYEFYGPLEFRRKKVPDVFCFLLSVMKPEQKIQVLTKYPYEILRCFLIWPWRYLFLDIAHLVMTFLPEKDYSLLLINVSSEVVDAAYHFPNLIQKFFLLIPAKFRKDFADCLCFFFPKFLCNEDAETIKIFLRNVDPERRTRLVLDSRFSCFLGDLMSKDDWPLVEVCLREASLSKENKEELKLAFINEFHPESDEDKKICLKRFFEILEENEV